MAARFADLTTDRVDYGSDASIDDLTIGSLVIVVNPADVSNSFRFLGGKGDAWQFFRRGVDGTRWAISHNTTGAAMLVDVATSNITANAVNFVAFTWEFTVSINAYWGTLSKTFSDKSSGANVGDGSFVTDAGANLTFGDDFAAVGNTNCMAMDIAWVGYYDRVLRLGELITLQDDLIAGGGCCRLKGELFASHFGLFGGMGLQADLSGHGRHGIVTGATFAPHGPIRSRRPRQFETLLGLQCAVPVAIDSKVGTWQDELANTTDAELTNSVNVPGTTSTYDESPA